MPRLSTSFVEKASTPEGSSIITVSRSQVVDEFRQSEGVTERGGA